MITEYWSIERETKGLWIKTEWVDKATADRASATMLADDETIRCIHRTAVNPQVVKMLVPGMRR